jgi:hypothetical protein
VSTESPRVKSSYKPLSSQLAALQKKKAFYWKGCGLGIGFCLASCLLLSRFCFLRILNQWSWDGVVVVCWWSRTWPQ